VPTSQQSENPTIPRPSPPHDQVDEALTLKTSKDLEPGHTSKFGQGWGGVGLCLYKSNTQNTLLENKYY